MNLKKNIYAGRSMIEMLAVLAIIGVLSIGSLSIFRRAMITKQVNDIVSDVSMLGTLSATTNQLYDGELCTFFEESGFKIPEYFETCTLNKDSDGTIIIKITYKNGEMSQKAIEALVNRCSKYLYISSDAQTFILDPKGRDCSADYSEEGTEEDSIDNEDPKDWDCITNYDCGGDRYTCKNHECVACRDFWNSNSLDDFSKECCLYYMNDGSYQGKILWNGTKCVVDPAYSGHCDAHESFGTGCNKCSYKMIEIMETADSRKIYCCDENETQKQCCEFSGGVWCEASAVCLSSSSGLSCNQYCEKAKEPTEGCECVSPTLTVVNSDTNEETAVCCNPTSYMSMYYFEDCCANMGGSLESNKCYLPKQEEEVQTCIKITKQANRMYNYDGSTVHLYTENVCCEGEMTESTCCSQNSGYWCSEQNFCATGGYLSNGVGAGGPQLCDKVCERYTSLPSACICTSFSIPVITSSTNKETRYCCDKNDTSMKQCCEKMGFSWNGTGNNTGACYN